MSDVPLEEISPLLPVQSGEVAVLLRLQCYGEMVPPDWEGAQPSYRFTKTAYISVRPDPDADAAGSVASAEDRLIAQAHRCAEPLADLTGAIMRQAMALSRRGRLGYANGILLHPDLARQIDPKLWSVRKRNGPLLGRWQSAGRLMVPNVGQMHVHTSHHLPPHDVILYYNKPANAAVAVLLESRAGLLLARSNDPDVVFDAPSDYLSRVLLTVG